MGDVGDHWREHRAYLKAQGESRGGARRIASVVKHTKADQKAGWVRHTDWHWQVRLGGDLLDYWPSRAKWRWRGVTKVGPRKELDALVAAEREGA